jgi:hypothetical protein
METIVFEVKGSKEAETVNSDVTNAAEEPSKGVVGECRFHMSDLIGTDLSDGQWFQINTLVKDSKSGEDVKVSVGELMLKFNHYAVETGYLGDIYGKLREIITTSAYYCSKKLVNFTST